MCRDIFTNKWVIGSIALLIVITVGCVSWYRYDTAPYRKEAAESAEMFRQWETTQKADIESNIEPVTDALVENIKPTTEKDKSETADVRVSPFGFGPYPEIPSDFPEQRLFDIQYGTPEAELLDRVRVKLWKEGIRPDGIGWLQSTGLIYPTVRGTIYVRWGEFRGKKYITRLRSHPVDHFDISKFPFENDIPSYLKVLDFSEGIDPYEYLGLFKEVHE